jgi:hypothetical protein
MSAVLLVKEGAFIKSEVDGVWQNRVKSKLYKKWLKVPVF